MLAKVYGKKSKDHGNFILLNNSVHINNSPTPTLQQRAVIEGKSQPSCFLLCGSFFFLFISRYIYITQSTENSFPFLFLFFHSQFQVWVWMCCSKNSIWNGSCIGAVKWVLQYCLKWNWKWNDPRCWQKWKRWDLASVYSRAVLCVYCHGPTNILIVYGENAAV